MKCAKFIEIGGKLVVLCCVHGTHYTRVAFLAIISGIRAPRNLMKQFCLSERVCVFNQSSSLVPNKDYRKDKSHFLSPSIIHFPPTELNRQQKSVPCVALSSPNAKALI